MMDYRRAVASAFAQAHEYQQRAEVQRRVAGLLAEEVAGFDLPQRPRILEIGCGTGFLSRHLLKLFPDASLLLTDIAPAMLSRCQASLGGIDPERVGFAIMDGENITHPGLFDLIVSSLAFQWFGDPLGNLENLVAKLAPGGCVAFMTLGDQSFREWRDLCAENEIPCGLHDYPDMAAWRRAWPDGGRGIMTENRISVEHPSPQAFLRELKKIGAALPPRGYRRASSTGLRRALRGHDEKKQAFSITYHLLYGSFIKD